MNESRKISVIICVYTLERWPDICEAVDSAYRQTLMPLEVIVVVDHNPELLERCREKFSAARVIENSKMRGLSGGRNTGIEAARGDLLAFLDDDAVAAPDWLSVLSGHFVRPEVLGVCSAVTPIWEGLQPDWFPPEFMWTVGCMHRDHSKGVQEIRNIQGGAAMLRRDIFARVGGFSASLGRKGSKIPLSCEETELCIRAKAAQPNGCFLFDPGTWIGHKVSLNRAQIDYFMKRCFAEGMSKAVLTQILQSRETLNVERDYVVHALGAGVVGEIIAFGRSFDLRRLKRAGATILGLGSAGLGYLLGIIMREQTPNQARVTGN